MTTAAGRRPGPRNDLTDVAGIRVGHHTAAGDGALTGATVVLAPDGGFTAGVDVRGGAPGTRETDLLHPTASVQRVHAILLTGGSAYGLAAADGVVGALEDAGVGFPVGRTPDTLDQIVPLVPTAVLFDLGRGGNFRARPDQGAGRAAVAAAQAGAPIELGGVGAGTGAACCGLKGGIGSASVVLPDGSTVAALVALNAAGSALDPRTGGPLGARLLLPGDGDVRDPLPDERDRLFSVIAAQDPHLVAARRTGPVLENTTLVVVATDATLTKSQCTKLAGLGHDGLARSLDPVHTSFDGDTVFGVSTGTDVPLDDLAYHDVLCAAADVVGRAVVRALLAARTVTTPAGTWPGYLDLAPSMSGRS